MGTFFLGNVSYDPAELNTQTTYSVYAPPYAWGPLYQGSFTFVYTEPVDVVEGWVYAGAVCANGSISWMTLTGGYPSGQLELGNLVDEGYPPGTVQIAGGATVQCPEGAGKIVGFAIEGTVNPECFWWCGGTPDPSNVLT